MTRNGTFGHCFFNNCLEIHLIQTTAIPEPYLSKKRTDIKLTTIKKYLFDIYRTKGWKTKPFEIWRRIQWQRIKKNNNENNNNRNINKLIIIVITIIIIYHLWKYLKCKNEKNIWHGWDVNPGPLNCQASTISTKPWNFLKIWTKKDKFEFRNNFGIFAKIKTKT